MNGLKTLFAAGTALVAVSGSEPALADGPDYEHYRRYFASAVMVDAASTQYKTLTGEAYDPQWKDILGDRLLRDIYMHTGNNRCADISIKSYDVSPATNALSNQVHVEATVCPQKDPSVTGGYDYVPRGPIRVLGQ